jgi:hypothetical protein
MHNQAVPGLWLSMAAGLGLIAAIYIGKTQRELPAVVNV